VLVLRQAGDPASITGNGTVVGRVPSPGALDVAKMRTAGSPFPRVAPELGLVYLPRLWFFVMSKDTTSIADNPTEAAGAGAAGSAPSEAPTAAGSASPEGAAAAAETPAEAPAPTPPQALSAAEWEALQAQAAKAEENRDRYLRMAADFENYKKRALRERQEGIRLANESLLSKLLSVLDNFEMALASNANAVSGADEAFRAGVAMIQSQLRNVLSEAGLEEVNAAEQPFDPNVHEAVAQLESSEVPEGQVLQQLRKGYKYRERLLRPASVVVARAPAPPAEAADSTPPSDH